MAAERTDRVTGGEALFRGLGRELVRHPWYPIIFWILLLVVVVPFLGRLGSVTTNSATTLPSSAPSAVAARELAAQFPSSSQGSESLIVISGANITGPSGQATTLAVARAVANDPQLSYVAGVDTVYAEYARYLTGTAQIVLGSSPIPVQVNASADAFWAVPALYVSTWSALVAAHPGTTPTTWNYPAFNATIHNLTDPTSQGILREFYSGTGFTTGGGFNGSAACGQDPSSVANCSTTVARQTFESTYPPDPANATLYNLTLENLGVANFSARAAQLGVAADLVQHLVGPARDFALAVFTAFPSGTASGSAVEAWASNVADNSSVATWPEPAPVGIWDQFVDPAQTATIVLVAYNVSDGYTTATGGTPVFDDVVAINSLLPSTLAAVAPAGTFTAQQTGGAPLDQTENTVLSSSLAVVLPLTVLVLIAITIVYFRAPLTPGVAFGALSIALVLGFGGVVLVGTLIGPVDSTSLTLATTFVLGVGTDYAIFLIARYREELWKGTEPKEAVVRTVTWAGQSIATSGGAAVIATLALAFSGVALLSQWGEVLSLAVAIAVLVALTVVPALLVLIGPRIFWPSTGEKFRKAAESTLARRRDQRTYFYRVAAAAKRRPKTIVALVLLASVPLFYVALTAPVAYDFYGQLPGTTPATEGLTALDNHFGPGWAFPTLLLVTFASPLLVGTSANATEFADIGTLTQELATTSGVASVDSPTGPAGATVSTWSSFSTLLPGDQLLLNGTLARYVGVDDRTVEFTVVPASPGLSATAVNLLGTIKSEGGAFAASHSDVTFVAYGGGASETHDIQLQVSTATERLAIAVSIGLIIVLLAVLRSALVPLLAVATIGLSIGWSWGVTNLVLGSAFGLPLFYFAPVVLFILILGLGIDYNIFLLTRVREERLNGRTNERSVVEGLASTGGIITAAAIILASAFAILVTGQFILLQAIGFAVAAAVLLDAMVVRTYLVPASLFLLGERIWWLPGRRRPPAPEPPAPATADAAPSAD